MPRYFNGGANAIDIETIVNTNAVDEEDKVKMRTDLKKTHPFTSPARDNLKVIDGKLKIKKPGSYCNLDQFGNPIPEWVDWEQGSIAFGILGYGFFVVPPNGHVDLDYTVPEDLVKAHAPHLLTEAEAMARGLVKPVTAEKSKPALK